MRLEKIRWWLSMAIQVQSLDATRGSSSSTMLIGLHAVAIHVVIAGEGLLLVGLSIKVSPRTQVWFAVGWFGANKADCISKSCVLH